MIPNCGICISNGDPGNCSNSASAHQCISLFWSFNQNDVVWLLYIKKKRRPGLIRVYPDWPGSGSTRRVDRVSPGQLPDGFLLRPGPVPCPGRPGPGSTRRAGPGFKTMVLTFNILQWYATLCLLDVQLISFKI
jgi:hypothetical protein